MCMYVCQFAKLHDENVRLITRRQKFCDHQESAICVKNEKMRGNTGECVHGETMMEAIRRKDASNVARRSVRFTCQRKK